MSKYNHMKSISFSELESDEIEQAIKEWAQGNIYMEKLLWACREHGIETQGCHPLGKPYLEFVVNNSHNEIKKMLNAAQSIPNSMIVIMPDGGNPISGEKTWYRPTITIGFATCNPIEINQILNKLYKSITLDKKQEEPENEVFAHMLDFYDLFAEKESGLKLYMTHNKGGEYNLEFVNRGDIENQTYYNNLFKKAGMETKDEKWNITSTDCKTPVWRH